VQRRELSRIAVVFESRRQEWRLEFSRSAARFSIEKLKPSLASDFLIGKADPDLDNVPTASQENFDLITNDEVGKATGIVPRSRSLETFIFQSRFGLFRGRVGSRYHGKG
jgi:hypothetical protein